MPIHHETMSNVKAQRVRDIADLYSRKTRKKTGLFLVEGPQSVREALNYAPTDVKDLYVIEGYESSDVLAELVDTALEHDIYVHITTSDVMHAISTDTQGICLVMSYRHLLREGLSELLAMPADGVDGTSKTEQMSLPQTRNTLIAACWELRDPGNAGTIIRVADACACQAVILVGQCVDVTNPKVVRSTAGSLFHIPVYYASEEEFFAWSRTNSAFVSAAEIYGTQDTPVVQLPQALRATDSAYANSSAHIVLFGNEARGLPASLVDQCDRAVSIPIYGKAESLNVAMSASVMLYAFAMQGADQLQQ